jgi:hypothetical protein
MGEKMLKLETGDCLLVHHIQLSLEIGCCADESAVTVSNHISMCVRVIENVKAVLPGYEKNRRLMEI